MYCGWKTGKACANEQLGTPCSPRPGERLAAQVHAVRAISAMRRSGELSETAGRWVASQTTSVAFGRIYEVCHIILQVGDFEQGSDEE